MIYIEENSFDKQLALFELLSDSGSLELVIWMYPESNLNNLFDLALYPSASIDAEPVTTYEKGVVTKCTERLPFDSRLLQKLSEGSKVIINDCDSLCVYLPGSYEWLACTVGHEGMGLVKNSNFSNLLSSSGFNISLEPPSWW